MYAKVDDRIKCCLVDIVGAKNVLTNPEEMEDYSHDEFSLLYEKKVPEVVVKPSTAEMVSRIAKLANEERIPLVPRGGGTGLCGGCVSTMGGIVMDIANLNRVLEIDKSNFMATVEAGVTLLQFYGELEKENLFFPPHPGDEGAMFGGLIATNAGGARAVKYGTIRNFVRGLEVITATGEILQLGGKLMKNSSGYNLLHLMLGSEGTLGIITKVVVSIMPPRKVLWSLVIPYNDLSGAMESVPHIIQKGVMPMTLEFLEEDVIVVAEDMLKKKWPCHGFQCYLMVTVDGTSEEEVQQIVESIADVCLGHGAVDVFVADSKEKQADMLHIRSQLYEALKPRIIEILDVVVPRNEIARHAEAVREIAKKYSVWLPTYGHAGDGNIHSHIMKVALENGKPAGLRNDWKDYYHQIRKEIHENALACGGMVSGEHGIGLIKKELLPIFVSEEQIRLMKEIKRVFDPHNILNPDKIFLS